jgi:hypothetical protein
LFCYRTDFGANNFLVHIIGIMLNIGEFLCWQIQYRQTTPSKNRQGEFDDYPCSAGVNPVYEMGRE